MTGIHKKHKGIKGINQPSSISPMTSFVFNFFEIFFLRIIRFYLGIWIKSADTRFDRIVARVEKITSKNTRAVADDIFYCFISHW